MIAIPLSIIHEEARSMPSHKIIFQGGNPFIIIPLKIQSSHHMIWTWLLSLIAIDTFPDFLDTMW